MYLTHLWLLHHITFISIISRKEPGYKAEKTIIRIDSYTKYFKHMAAITSELIITMTDNATSTWIAELALCTRLQLKKSIKNNGYNLLVHKIFQTSGRTYR
jgi:hypothetical protein